MRIACGCIHVVPENDRRVPGLRRGRKTVSKYGASVLDCSTTRWRRWTVWATEENMAEIALGLGISVRTHISSVSTEKRQSKAESMNVPGMHEVMDNLVRGIGLLRLISYVSAE